MTGIPWLSQIPGFKYLFGQSNKELPTPRRSLP